MVRFPKIPEELPGNFWPGWAKSNECPNSFPSKVLKWCHTKCLNLLRDNIPLTQHIYQGGEGGEESKLGITAAIFTQTITLELRFSHSGVQGYPWNKLSLQRARTTSTLHPKGGEQSINITGQRDKQHLRGKKKDMKKKSQCFSQEFRYLQSNQKIKERNWEKIKEIKK